MLQKLLLISLICLQIFAVEQSATIAAAENTVVADSPKKSSYGYRTYRPQAVRETLQTVKQKVRLPKKWQKAFEALGKKLQYKPLKHLTIEEIDEELVKLRKNKDYFLMEKFLQEGIKKCSNQDHLAELRMELAETYYTLRAYDKAAAAFGEYADLYPNSPKAPYALRQSITIAAQQLLSPDRDQGRTKDLLERVHKFLENKEAAEYAPYVSEIQTIELKCIKNLQMSEVLTFYYYLNNGALSAAQKRLEYIKKEYVPKLPEIEVDIMVLEYELAFARQDKALSAQISQELAKKSPASAAKLAKKGWSAKELL